MTCTPILLFLDIDGVIDVYEDDVPGERLSKHNSEKVHPVTGAKEFLQIIAQSPWIQPMWISSWGEYSSLWNDWSGTRQWPVAYPLDRSKHELASKLFPGAEDKYLAARYHSRDWQEKIVWIEDWILLDRKILKWTEENSKVQLINTSLTPTEWRKGYKKGIRHSNIHQICEALNIEPNLVLSLRLEDEDLTFLQDITEKPSLSNVSSVQIRHEGQNSTELSNQKDKQPQAASRWKFLFWKK